MCCSVLDLCILLGVVLLVPECWGVLVLLRGFPFDVMTCVPPASCHHAHLACCSQGQIVLAAADADCALQRCPIDFRECLSACLHTTYSLTIGS